MLFGGVLFLCARMPSSRASRRVATDNAALKAKLLPAIAKGDLILGVAWQAQLGGLNPMTIATTAVAQPSGSIVLNGAKRFVAPAAGADLAIPHWLSCAGYPAIANSTFGYKHIPIERFRDWLTPRRLRRLT